MREKCRRKDSLVVIQLLQVVGWVAVRRGLGRLENHPAPRRIQCDLMLQNSMLCVAWCLLSLEDSSIGWIWGQWFSGDFCVRVGHSSFPRLTQTARQVWGAKVVMI